MAIIRDELIALLTNSSPDALATYLAQKLEVVAAIEGGNLQVSEDYGNSQSFQPIAVDLNITGAGSDDPTDTAFLSPIMGNLLGDDVDGEGNYLAGLIGAYSALGAASDYPVGGIMGLIFDSAEGADAPVVSVIDGDDPSGVTRTRAMFAARFNNNNAGSGADFGLDLYDAGNPNYSGGPVPLAFAKGDIRMQNKVLIMQGAGVPTNGSTGDNEAGTGSLYIDITNGDLYIQQGAITNPTWLLVNP